MNWPGGAGTRTEPALSGVEGSVRAGCRVPHSFAHFANEWALTVSSLLGLSVDRSMADSEFFGQLPLQQLLQILSQLGDIVLSALVGPICRLQTGNVGRSVFTNPFRHGFLATENSSLFHANQVVASRPRRSSVAFNERMYPVQIP